MNVAGLFLLNRLFAEEEGPKRYRGSEKVKSRKDIFDKRNERRRYSFEDYMFYKVKKEQKLLSFFELLGEYGKKIHEIDRSVVLEELLELITLYKEKEKEVDDRLLEVEESGITISTDIRTEKSFIPPKDEKTDFFLWNEKRDFSIGFNGIRITSEMLAEGNVYQEEYMAWQKENPDVDKVEIDFSKKLKDKKRRLIITVFDRQKIKEEIYELEKELQGVRAKIREGREKKEKMNIFNNLTEVQKNAISKYLESIKSCETIGKESGKKLVEIVRADRGIEDIKKDKWPRAFDKMIEEGAVSQDIIDNVNAILRQEIASKQRYYDYGGEIYDTEHTIGAVSWYIKEQERSQEKALQQSVAEQTKGTMIEIDKNKRRTTYGTDGA